MNQAGFNLIELCVVMSITIILSGSGIFAYQQHQHDIDQKGAIIDLHDIALTLEEHQDLKTGYQNLSLDNLDLKKIDNNYEFSLSTSESSFIISAKPLFTDSCGTLSLNQLGKIQAENCTL